MNNNDELDEILNKTDLNLIKNRIMVLAKDGNEKLLYRIFDEIPFSENDLKLMKDRILDPTKQRNEKIF
jgi:hypothetical protein